MSFFPELPALHLVIERDAFTEKVGAALDQFIIEYAPERERVLTMLGIVTEAEADQDEGGVI